ncbi:methyl-accepting chemotaxis protein [Salipiger sp.]|uniref:methyl-accepting chemotaxis protein n=1 Tax=Salipiger sp. TaxID=2078585 RepID=UPI003A9814B8
MLRLRHSVSNRLLMATGSAIAALVLGLTALSGWQAATTAREQVLELAQAKAANIASEVAVEVTVATAAGTALAGALSGYLETGEATDTGLLRAIRAVPSQYSRIFGAWIAGVPDGTINRRIDGDRARNDDSVLSVWWTKSGSDGLTNIPFPVNPEAAWFTTPLETDASVITDPYIAEGGFLITSVAVPVRIEGQIVAISGVDITLNTLVDMLGGMTAFDGGLTQLVSSSGQMLATPDPERLTTPYDGPGADLVTAALEDGAPRQIELPNGDLRLVYPFTAPGMNTTWVALLDVPKTAFVAPVRQELISTGLEGLATLALALLTLHIVTGKLLRKPLARMLETVGELAQGTYGNEVPYTSRSDEIGAMATSVETLRHGLLEKTALEARQAERQDVQAAVVAQLAGGLGKVARGDLEAHIEQAFPAEYESLRQDFNEMLRRLSELVGQITDSTRSIVETVNEITGATGDLSLRTERSAATLEQTAAALSEMTDLVRAAANAARETDKLVGGVNEKARTSSTVVGEAVEAMGQIEESSDRIRSIINVIDDIAFQTNLLALNAGVEAARAGSSGQGFAVVASEVRTLAQRTSDAAREIGGLISDSGDQVSHGVELVGRASGALQEIIGSIDEISGQVSRIASSSDEQAGGIVEINTAVGELDRTQQHNAAMFEETSAACAALSGGAEDLKRLLAQFRIAPGTAKRQAA